MAGVEGKGRTKLSHSDRSDELTIINGRVLVRLVPRGTVRRGVGSAQLKDGIASKGELRIIDGAVRLRF